jgi:hypothetical protein
MKIIDRDRLLHEYRAAKEMSFALELGHKIHDALGLEQETQIIDRKISRLSGNSHHNNRNQINLMRYCDENSSEGQEPATESMETVEHMMRRLGINNPISAAKSHTRGGKMRMMMSPGDVVIMDAIEKEKRRSDLLRKDILHSSLIWKHRSAKFNNNKIIRNKLIREQEQEEKRKNLNLVQAYDNLSETKKQMIQDQLIREAEETRMRSAHNRLMLARIRKEIREKRTEGSRP